MAVQVYEIIEFCSQRYGDQITYTGGVKDSEGSRITESEWIKYIKDAIRLIMLVRPDANAVTASVQLVQGTKQSLPTNAIRLIDITRNMGTNGSTAGKPIREVDREVMDLMFSTWHSATAETDIDNFMYDPRRPREFYVTPPSDGNGYVEMTTSQIPTLPTGPTDYIPISDIFVTAIQDWCLYLGFSMDSDSAPDWQIGQHYYKTFASTLGIEYQTLLEIQPPAKEPEK